MNTTSVHDTSPDDYDRLGKGQSILIKKANFPSRRRRRRPGSDTIFKCNARKRSSEVIYYLEQEHIEVHLPFRFGYLCNCLRDHDANIAPSGTLRKVLCQAAVAKVAETEKGKHCKMTLRSKTCLEVCRNRKRGAENKQVHLPRKRRQWM